MLTIYIVTLFLVLISSYQYSAQVTGTISRQKCREYGQNLNTCNLSKDEIVQYGQFPHIASIGHITDKLAYGCSGVLISDQYIVTTSFCGLQKHTGQAKLGVLNIEDATNETHIQEINITEIFDYPIKNIFEYYNGISLLKLEHPVEINEYVRPACLPDLNEEHDEYILTGWELFDKTHKKVYLTAHHNIFEILTDKCNRFYRNQLPNGIDALHQICAGPAETVCKMLGGAPLQSLDKNVNCMYDIHGISSYGSNCPTEYPTVFTKIAPYIDWIEKIVWA